MGGLSYVASKTREMVGSFADSKSWSGEVGMVEISKEGGVVNIVIVVVVQDQDQ